MVEIILWSANHAEFLHDPLGSDVSSRRKRDDLIQRKLMKAKAQGCPRTLGGIATPPMRSGETPANFNGRIAQRIVGGTQPDKPDEVGDARNFDGPQAPPLVIHVLVDAVGKHVRFAS